MATDDGRRWFTSRELHDIEERFVDVVTRRDTTAAIDPGAVTAALTTRPTLGADQATAVSRLAASCEPLSVLIGPAGTGKTYTLDTVRDAYRTGRLAGHRRRPVGPGRPGAHRRRRHPGPHPARPARRRRPRPRVARRPHPARRRRSRHGRHPHPPSRRRHRRPVGAAACCSSAINTRCPRSAPAAASPTPPPTPAPSPSSPSTAASEPSGNSRRSPRCATAACPTPSAPTSTTAGSWSPPMPAR